MTNLGRRVAWAVSGLGALVLIVALSMCPAGRQPPAPLIAGTELKLGAISLVEGTDMFRAELYDNSGSYSSGYGRLRNVAFIQKSGEAHWLLADDDHLVFEHPIPPEPMYGRREAVPPAAYVAVVKPAGSGARVEGQMLLYDPQGSNIEIIGEGILGVHGVAQASAKALVVLYERPGRYMMATFDPMTLAKRSEVGIALPQLR